MLSTLIHRDQLIIDCAELYGTDPHIFRVMDQPVLERAWLVAREHWS